MRYLMLGVQTIYLEGGRAITPATHSFTADREEMPEHLEAWFEQIGAIRKVEAPPEPPPRKLKIIRGAEAGAPPEKE